MSKNTKISTIIFVSTLVLAIVLSAIGGAIESAGVIKDPEIIKKIGLCMTIIYFIFFLLLSFSAVPLFVRAFINMQIKIGNKDLWPINFLIRFEEKIVYFLWGFFTVGLIFVGLMFMFQKVV